MTHCDRVLALLADGQPHSHHEGYALNVILHSRVSELRRRGHVIWAWREGDLYLYQLHGLTEGESTAELLESDETPESDRSPSVSSPLSQSAPLSPPRAHRDAGDGLATPPGGGADWLSDQLTLTEAA